MSLSISHSHAIRREIEACNELITSLRDGFEQVMLVKAKCPPRSLIPPGIHYASALFDMTASVDQSSFYGRCIGFHVSGSNVRSKTTSKLFGHLFMYELLFFSPSQFSVLRIDANADEIH